MPAIPNSEMGETKIHKIALHQLEEKGRKLIEYAQEHPLQFGLISITIVAGVAIITVPLALGFSSTGPVAGSIAAAWQSSIGNVVANSFFALLQSMAMSGTFETIGISLVGAGTVAAFVEWSKGVDFHQLIAGWLRFTQSIGFNPESIDWSEGEKLVRSVNWEGAANDVAGSVDRAVQEAMKHATWLGENAQGVDWARVGDEVVRGAGPVMNDVVQGAGWAVNEAAQMIEMFARRLM
ncbi:uncharacterized protein H6S33_012677 [Morchella sextelata]|uniref:uncharacterized protein n=1 Tax=Morchella sextelata TaxID=1174677 RepID=UPI001D042219|nr:uncharacterized protein H6S33_012677 [Morchella sextelata]KAH0610131.1 hypothetical protein H6S33_012677 [Morchella sextelata]